MVSRLALTFVRHGMTKENEEKRYIGFSDVPLLDQEVARLRNVSAACSPDFVVTSDLWRCRQTCRLLFAETIPVYERSAWREINFGDWEGKTYAELKEVEEYRKWLDSPFTVAPPNGEHYREFQARIENALTETIALAKRRLASHVVIVTHGGPIRYVLERYAPMEKPFWEWTVPFGGGFTLVSERWEERARCISLSEVRFKESENGSWSTTN